MIGPGIAKIASGPLPPSPATLQVDVIADFVCPWCFLGKRRLDDALQAVHGPSLVTWLPYQLNPDMPDAGMPLEEYLAGKFGDPQQLEPALKELQKAGRKEGIDFRFDRIERVPSTLNAHRLMQYCEQQGSDASALADAILTAFFTDGRDIGDPEVLADIAAAQVADRKAVLQALEDERMRSIVRSQEAQVRQSGVTGVPDFLINKRLFVVGAQPTDGLVNVFDRAMFGAESDLPVSASVH